MNPSSSALTLTQIPENNNSFMYIEETLHGNELPPLCNSDHDEWWPLMPFQSSADLEFPPFDDISGDFTTMWDPSFHQYEVSNHNNNDDVLVDVKPLMTVPASATGEMALSFDDDDDDHLPRIEQAPAIPPAVMEEERFQYGGVIRYGNKSSALSYDEIRRFFDVPISAAAKELHVGVTVLKKRCRELNIKRWPHRKIKSLSFLIQNAKDMGLTSEVSMLEEHKRMIHRIPEMELTERTKKLRQACFKANYKKRRALGIMPAAAYQN